MWASILPPPAGQREAGLVHASAVYALAALEQLELVCVCVPGGDPDEGLSGNCGCVGRGRGRRGRRVVVVVAVVRGGEAGETAAATDCVRARGSRRSSRPTTSVSSTPSATIPAADEMRPRRRRRRRRGGAGSGSGARCGRGRSTEWGRSGSGTGRGKSGNCSRAARPSSGSTSASSGLTGPSSEAAGGPLAYSWCAQHRSPANPAEERRLAGDSLSFSWSTGENRFRRGCM